MNKFFFLLFFIILFTAESFFNFFSVGLEENDIIFIISLFFPFYRPIKFVKYIKNNQFLILIFSFLFLLNFWSSYLNYNQDLIYSLRSGRFLLTYIFLGFVVYLFVQNNDKINYVPIIIPVILIAINFYPYLTNDFSIFNEDLYVSERFEDIRFMVAGTSVIYLTIYFFNRIEQKKIYLYCFLFLFTVIVLIAKTRGIIFGLLLVFMFSNRIKKFLGSKKGLKFIILVGIPLLAFFGKYILNSFEALFSSTMADLNSQDNNVQIRFLTLEYYWNILSESTYSILFGNGIPSEFTIGKFQDNLYLSDVGVFKIIFNHGIVGFLLIVTLLVSPLFPLKKNNGKREKNLFFQDYRSFVLFQLFTFISLTFFYHPLGIVCFFMVYFHHKKKEEISYSTNHFQTI